MVPFLEQTTTVECWLLDDLIPMADTHLEL